MRNNMNAVQNVSKRRDDRAGRRCTIGNRVYAKSVSGVRIPISPPELSRRNLYGNAFFIQSALKTGRLHPMRRGGRVVECGGLENRLARNPGHGGSNPPSSASSNAYRHGKPCLFCFTTTTRGFEPMRSIRARKTARWAVFSESRGGFSRRGEARAARF